MRAENWRIVACLILFSLCLLCSLVDAEPTSTTRRGSLAEAATGIHWEKVSDGFFTARYDLHDDKSLIKPEALLLKFDPRYFSFHVQLVSKAAVPIADAKTVTEQVGGVAGVNGNFFDENHLPIGFLVIDGVMKQPLHRGGNVLTGVFLVEGENPRIVARDNLPSSHIIEALQAGPRLIVGTKAVPPSPAQTPTRRSGVAVTKDHQVIIYATPLRFPGASLEQIQEMLLRPELEVEDALNLDGGSSSQLYVRESQNRGEMFFSGGSQVPVFLVVKQKVVR